ncbi:MAG: ABC transporter substrate-binding protein [Chloroflexi bacterium]|nr:ABC transporter substrate-binding protein [Chloroflexota bacterium]
MNRSTAVRLLGVPVLLLVVAFSASACASAATPIPQPAQAATSASSNPSPTSPPSAPTGSKTIRIATGQGCTAMSISIAGGVGPCDAQIREVYSALTWRTAEGQVVADLATSWTMTDANTWQFKLRDGATFQNGEPVNADAIKFSWDKALDPKANWPIRSNIVLVDNVTVVDEHTVSFHTSKPWPDMPFFAATVYIMPPKYTQQVGDDGLVAKPVGSGPYEVVDFAPNDHLTLKAYAGYYAGKPKIDQVQWRIIPEPATRAAALQSGDVDIASQIPMDLIPTLKSASNLHVDFANEQVTLQLFMDTLQANGSPVADVRVRQAIDYGIDKETIWKSLLGGLGALNDQMLTSGVFGYDSNIQPTKYDPDMAKQLLAQAGYANGLKLQLQCPVGKYLVDRDACLAIKDQLSKVGIDVTANIEDQGVWVDYLKNPTKRADMIFVGWYSYGNPAQAMQWFSKTQPWHRWENDKYDQLFLDAKTNLDQKQREQDYFQMADIVKAEVPSVFLWQQAAPYGVSNRVVNWKPHPNQYVYLVDTDIN